MDKLLGCVQMVANMLLRDEKPARVEAAEELKTVAADVMNELTELRAQTAKLTKQRDLAVNALNAVKVAMNHSEGIAGWHLNGNIATWYEVLPEVDDALAVIKSTEVKK
jgi:hypothetical protein